MITVRPGGRNLARSRKSNSVGSGEVVSQPSVPQPRVVTLPEVADNPDATVLRYIKKEGDETRKDEDIVDLDYGEFVISLEGQEGVVGKIVAAPGARVSVGDPLFLLLKSRADYEAWRRLGTSAGANDVFDELSDGAEFITKDQLREAIAKLGLGFSLHPDAADTAFKKVDRDGDDVITREEFREAIKELLRQELRYAEDAAVAKDAASGKEPQA